MYDIISVMGDVSHADAIYELDCECFPNDNWSHKLIYSELSVGKSCYLVCMDDNKLIGYLNASYILDEAELNRIAVKPNYRRKGIAKGLIGKLIDCLKTRNCTLLMLEVRSKNTDVVSLYDSLGFKKDTIRKNYYQNPTDDAVLMSLNL